MLWSILMTSKKIKCVNHEAQAPLYVYGFIRVYCIQSWIVAGKTESGVSNENRMLYVRMCTQKSFLVSTTTAPSSRTSKRESVGLKSCILFYSNKPTHSNRPVYHAYIEMRPCQREIKTGMTHCRYIFHIQMDKNPHRGKSKQNFSSLNVQCLWRKRVLLFVFFPFALLNIVIIRERTHGTLNTVSVFLLDSIVSFPIFFFVLYIVVL